MQEEGWVVCRAFKKPSPNQNQVIGAWNSYQHQALYYDLKNNTNNNNSQFVRSPSFSDAMTPHTHMVNSSDQQLPNLHNPYTSNLHHHQLVQLPNLESPKLSTNFGTNEIKIHNYNNNNHDGPCLEWNNVDLDVLLSTSQIVETPHSSYPNLSQTFVDFCNDVWKQKCWKLFKKLILESVFFLIIVSIMREISYKVNGLLSSLKHIICWLGFMRKLF